MQPTRHTNHNIPPLQSPKSTCDIIAKQERPLVQLSGPVHTPRSFYKSIKFTTATATATATTSITSTNSLQPPVHTFGLHTTTFRVFFCTRQANSSH
ncbi:hypothetical protein EYC84_001823 [Monilinia fructicola]|uniref:Uncharacterized protein n=1 Tax=Monilinia fructicola TaxID=38448 RepID=A0A5M9JUT1_MONFR|nr:hypothetical protein EYC84_001823 [Monilinia fructicola]